MESARETPVDRSLWKLVGAFLWVRITDKFLPSCLISHLVVALGVLLLHLQTLYIVYSPPSLSRLLGKIACINKAISGFSGNKDFVMDSGSCVHATGDKKVLDPNTIMLGQTGETVTVGNGSVLQVAGHGSVNRANLKLPCVLYVPGLMVNVLSVRQLTALDYQVQFVGDEFFVREVCTDAMVGRGRIVGGMYQVEYLQVPLDRGRCLNCLILGRIYDQS